MVYDAPSVDLDENVDLMISQGDVVLEEIVGNYRIKCYKKQVGAVGSLIVFACFLYEFSEDTFVLYKYMI